MQGAIVGPVAGVVICAERHLAVRPLHGHPDLDDAAYPRPLCVAGPPIMQPKE
jgi:hypothetical protein